MTLIKKLPTEYKYDFVGDIHGEYDSLMKLIGHLGYDQEGRHFENRKLVFLGDFVDRGPKTVSTIFFIKSLIDKGNAFAILGNHELNTLNLDFKPGSSWFFGIPQHSNHHEHIFEPCEKATLEQKSQILDFFNTLPLVLENDNIRLVHASWHEESVEYFKKNYLDNIKDWHAEIHQSRLDDFKASSYYETYKYEKITWHSKLHDINEEVPFLEASAQYNLIQASNPFKMLTAGYETLSEKAFFIQKWRFVQRHAWWDDYNDDIPVIIGHYWRRFEQQHPEKNKAQDESLFENIEPLSYFGAKKNVFCIDYAIGLTYAKRLGKNHENLRLAAFRFPEQKVCFDNGDVFDVTNPLYLEKSNGLCPI